MEEIRAQKAEYGRPIVSHAVKRAFAVLAAVSIGVGGYLHYDVWNLSYRYAPVRELFLLNAGLSVLVAVALLVLPRRPVALGGLLLSAGSLGAFALSRGPGLPTLHGKFTEFGLQPHSITFLGQPAALDVLLAEGLALILCVVVLVWPSPI